MSPALLAHLRLFPTIPRERIHTHEQHPARRPILVKGEGKHARTARLNFQINDMKRRGYTHLEIIDELQVSWTTVSKHLNGHVKSARRARRR